MGRSLPYSDARKAQMVDEYLALPRAMRHEWLSARHLTAGNLYDWRHEAATSRRLPGECEPPAVRSCAECVNAPLPPFHRARCRHVGGWLRETDHTADHCRHYATTPERLERWQALQPKRPVPITRRAGGQDRTYILSQPNDTTAVDPERATNRNSTTVASEPT